MEILVSIKNSYGNELVYPECNKAKAFAQIAGAITLTDHTMNQIKELGYTINVKQKELK